MVRNQLTEIQTMALVKPTLNQILQTDLTIWLDIEPTITMKLGLRQTSVGGLSTSWQSLELHEIFWQGSCSLNRLILTCADSFRFGTCHFKHGNAAECALYLIIPNSIANTEEVREISLIAQSQKGVDLCHISSKSGYVVPFQCLFLFNIS